MKDRLDPAPIDTVIEGFDPGDATDESATTILEQAIQTAASSVEITQTRSGGGFSSPRTTAMGRKLPLPYPR